MKAPGLTLTVFWVTDDPENVSSSALLSFGLVLGNGVAVDEVVETKSRQGPNIDLWDCTGSLSFSFSLAPRVI